MAGFPEIVEKGGLLHIQIMTLMQKFTSILVISILIGFCAYCNSEPHIPPIVTGDKDTLERVMKKSYDFLKKWDLDGDGIHDGISFKYSGGQHCCYKIEITLSSDRIKRKYPFEMDGGYVFGVDDSRPYHFNIKDFDNDGSPEIFMEISTYSGIKFPVEKKWTKKYGIKTNYILFDFKDGSIVVRDFTPKNRSAD